jgi:predicted ABC-type ATPase
MDRVPTPPQAVIIAGPNGSGKSTAATMLLPTGMQFVNADLIAQEISGQRGTTADINAGRLLLQRVDALESARRDFAFETTLATKMLADRVRHWRSIGYQVHLIFFYLPSEDLAVERVRGRVLEGGHDVPEQTVRRRFRSGLSNLFGIYMPLVDSWRMYDNSGEHGPALVAKQAPDGTVSVVDRELWETLRRTNG